MTSKEYMDSIENVANGDISTYKKELGFDEGHFADGGCIVRIDVKPLMKFECKSSKWKWNGS